MSIGRASLAEAPQADDAAVAPGKPGGGKKPRLLVAKADLKTIAEPR